ncbi:MAG: radical SAM protein [Oscillospiraceae bacterium]|nr:radical SAM protein [Oscillospiraceae bacterium]
MLCSLCPRNCNSIRTDNENLNGYCKMPLLPKVARADLHFWEEPCISGTKGSGTVFFSGCTLSCVYCQNYELSHNAFGKIISYERLAEIFKELEEKGAHNINLVNPTHYVFAIKKALEIYKPNIPIVYNSGGFERVETLKALEGYIDIFLMDFKYYSSEKALEYSNAYNYPEIAKKALLECYRQKKNSILEDGIMKSGLIIRHLILPKATNDAISVFKWHLENTPNAFFSMMSQYLPYGKAENFADINRRITKREHEKVLSYILESKKGNVFVQEMDSSSEKYIPNFNLSGI